MKQEAPVPEKNHGTQYLVLFSDGSSGSSFTMRYNGYEFKSPYGQAYHEATVLCRKTEKALQSILALPMKENNPFIHL